LLISWAHGFKEDLMLKTYLLFNNFLIAFRDNIAWILFKLSIEFFDSLSLIIKDALRLFKNLRIHSILGSIKPES
jgi:hypothetical protein